MGFTGVADAAKAQAGSEQPSSKGIPAHPPRATDAFYAKLLPALEVRHMTLILYIQMCLPSDAQSMVYGHAAPKSAQTDTACNPSADVDASSMCKKLSYASLLAGALPDQFAAISM